MSERIKIEMNQAEAETIVRAHDTATGETPDDAVADKVLDQIAMQWPELRAKYSIGLGMGSRYVEAVHHSDGSTHTWLLKIESWPEPPSANNPMPLRTFYAAPECIGVHPHRPFCTAIARETELVVLLPVAVSAEVREEFHKALEVEDMTHASLNPETLRKARTIVLRAWQQMSMDGRMYFDSINAQWRLV